MRRAIRRYHVTLLNYTMTSNHVHLLVLDDGPRGSIAQAMHLAAGRTAQEYNIRKHRGGAFWEDRYHATAVATDIHLLRCMFYIDLNMVRAGVIAHPEEWPYCGFQEIIASRQRYKMIEKLKLCRLLGVPASELAFTYQRWINDYIKDARLEKESLWTQSLAVGKEGFVRSVKKQLGLRAKYRKIYRADDTFELKENLSKWISAKPA